MLNVKLINWLQVIIYGYYNYYYHYLFDVYGYYYLYVQVSVCIRSTMSENESTYELADLYRVCIRNLLITKH